MVVGSAAAAQWRDALKGTPLFTSRNAVLFAYGDALLKFFRPRHFISDYVRRYAGLPLARKEAADYALLARIDLHVPRVLGTRTLWNPCGAFESVIALEHLADKATALEFLQRAPEPERLGLLRHIADDLQRMWNAWILHGDLRFGNILVGGDLVPYWLDPGLKRFRDYASMRKATDRVIGRFIRLNFHLIGSQGVALLCSLQLPDSRVQLPGERGSAS